jgi:hypothetical protein
MNKNLEKIFDNAGLYSVVMLYASVIAFAVGFITAYFL